MVATGREHDVLPPVAFIGHRIRHVRSRQFVGPDFLTRFDIERAEPLIGRRTDKPDAADIPYTTGQRQCARNRTDGKSMTRPPPDLWTSVGY